MIAADGRTVIIGDRNEIHLAELSTRRCPGPPMRPGLRTNTGFVRALDLSLEGDLLASGSSDGGLALWDLEQRTQFGEHLNRPSHDRREIGSIAWLPGGRVLMVGSLTLPRLWPTAVGDGAAFSLEAGDERSRTVARSRDGQLLAGSSREGVYLWDSSSGRIEARFALEKPVRDVRDDAVSALALSAAAKLLAVGQERGRLSLFDLERKQLLGDLPPPPGCIGLGCSVDSLDISSDGLLIAVVQGRKLILWPLAPESWVRRACEIANRTMTPDERDRYLGVDSDDPGPC